MSAPSGTGKTTLVERLVATPGFLHVPVVHDAADRQGEPDGVDYNFVTAASVSSEMRAAGEFLEWADVFGDFYGTGAGDTERVLAAGADLVLVIDVQGARQVRRRGSRTWPCSCCRRPSGARAAAARPEPGSGGGDPAAAGTGREEVAAFAEYDYVVVNDELDACVDRLRSIVLAERARASAMRGR